MPKTLDVPHQFFVSGQFMDLSPHHPVGASKYGWWRIFAAEPRRFGSHCIMAWRRPHHRDACWGIYICTYKYACVYIHIYILHVPKSDIIGYHCIYVYGLQMLAPSQDLFLSHLWFSFPLLGWKMKFLLATTNQIQFEDEDPKSKSLTAHVYGSRFGYPTFRWSILNILNILNIFLNISPRDSRLHELNPFCIGLGHQCLQTRGDEPGAQLTRLKAVHLPNIDISYYKWSV